MQVGATGKVITSAAKGTTGDWLLDPTNIDIVTGGTDGISGSNISPTTVINALGSTNVTLEATNDITISNAIDYSSSNTLSLLASQDIIANASVQNSGTGAINLIAGWDGETTNLSQLTNPGVYGNNNGTITIGGESAAGNVAIGSAGGTTTLAAANLIIESDNGYAQAGYHGAGGGNIVVDLKGDLTLTANYSGGDAQIGNGSLSGDISGNVTGNISINAAGTTTINVGEGGGTGWIGNFANEGSIESGNLTLITGSGNLGNFGVDVVADLGSTSHPGSGGNVLIGFTNHDFDIDNGGGSVNSPHSLTLMSVDNVYLGSTIQNSGSGNINVVAGWDGVTTNLSSLTNSGVYGNNGGSILIGGENADENVAVGSAGGTTTFAAASLTIESDYGYAQAGYHGAGGGNIDIDLTGCLNLNGYGGENDYAQIGNGSLNGDVSGNVTGNISIHSGGPTTINIGEGSGTPWIGNFAGEGSIESGNLTLITGSIQDQGEFSGNIVADLGTTSQPGSGGDVMIGLTDGDIQLHNDLFSIGSSPHNLTLMSVDNVELGSALQNSGTGGITIVAGWDGVTTNPALLTTSGVYGNNGGSIIIGGENAPGNVAIGSAGGTTTFAAANLTVESDNGYAQAGYHGAGGGNIDIDLTGSLSVNGYGTGNDYAMVGNGSLNGDVSGNITGSISINAPGTTTINVGEGGTSSWIGNYANKGWIESGNVQLITGYIQGDTGSTTLGDMLVADLGTTSETGSGGNVTFGLTNAQTDFINTYLGANAIEYNSPNALTILSTDSLTLPYSIQNDGAGALTILAGWNPSVAPANVLTTPGAYGNTTNETNYNGGTDGAFIWVVGETGTLDDYNPNAEGGTYVNSGAGVAIGSKGGTTTIGAAQIYIEGLSGYAQIGYHNTGGTGAIDVIANGVPGTGGLTGIGACFDGNANICIVGGRQGATDENNDPSYAQIGDLGYGVAGTASADINVSATGNIAVAGGGIYDNSDEGAYDPQIPDAYGMIGNGDGAQTVAQTVSGTIDVNVAGQLNFASSAGAGSDAWLGNRTGSGGLSSGDLTVIAGSENDTGPIDFGDMIFADLGSTSQPGSGGNVTVGMTDQSIDIQNTSEGSYNSPNNLTVLSVDNIYFDSSIQNSGSGDITAVAGWDGQTTNPSQLTNSGVYGNNGGSITIGGTAAAGDVSVGSAGGTTTVLTDNLDVESDNGIAQLGYAGAGTGAIDVVALGDVTVDALDGTYAQIGNGGAAVAGNVGGAIGVSAGGTILVESDAELSNAAIGNIGGAPSSQSGNITLGANALDINSVGQYSDAFVGNGPVVASTGGATGGIAITSGDVSLDASGDGSQAFVGDGGQFNSSGTTGGNIDINSATLELVANETDRVTSEARIANRGLGNVVGSYDIVTTGNIEISATDANLAAIGNGEDGTGTSTGSLTVQSGGTIALQSTDGGQTRIGNGDAPDSAIGVTAAGDITLSVTGNPGEYGSGGVLIGNLGAAAGGDISVASTGGSISLNAGEYGSAIQIGNIQNGVQANVSGNIQVTAKDNLYLNAAGNSSEVQIGNGGADTQGDDTGNVSVTATTGELSAAIDGTNSYLQLGNGGNGATGSATGDTTLKAGTSLQLAVTADAADSGSYIQVGDGATFGATSGGGNIIVNSSSMSTSNSVDFVGNSLDIALTGAGQSVGADSELWVVTNDLAITTNNGSAFVYAPQGVSLGVGEDGIDLGTGGLILSAAGPVTQTQAIDAATLGVTTTSGAITLTNAQNAIANAALGTSGSDNAILYDSTNLTMNGGGTSVGGNLTLLAEGDLTFT
ncbi:MAG: hypothetical protein ABSC92_05320, partial [Rhizomicrobium sp.]